MISGVITVEPRGETAVSVQWLSTHVTNGIRSAGSDLPEALRHLANVIEITERNRASLPD